MKVLLIATDLYRNIGGGQTVYRRLIESAPEVQFFYFREGEPERAARPSNTTAISLSIRLKLKVLGAPPYPAFKLAHLQDADRFARSVAGQHFDIADIPDYFAFGSLLRDAFAHHRVTVDRIVLAMHGNISVSLEMRGALAATTCSSSALWNANNSRVLTGRMAYRRAIFGSGKRSSIARSATLTRSPLSIFPRRFGAQNSVPMKSPISTVSDEQSGAREMIFSWNWCDGSTRACSARPRISATNWLRRGGWERGPSCLT